MEKSDFGRELEGRKEFFVTLDEFKDLILYYLEDYLFHTKLNDKVTNISIPALGINFSVDFKQALDLRLFFNIPQISFDEKGCLYNNGVESAYISPEFLAKCFIERVVDIWNFISKLYLPKVTNNSKDKEDSERETFAQDKEKQQISHIDFVDSYNNLVDLKRTNNILTQGMVGLGENFNNAQSVTNLRKIEIAAEIQKDLEFVLGLISNELYEDELSDYGDDFTQNDEYKVLKSEHDRLFKIGSIVAPLEPSEWEFTECIYDEGTDEERNEWQKKYNKFKEDIKTKKAGIVKKAISGRKFPLSELEKRVISYLKAKILVYDYRGNEGYPGNPYINELGLDKTSYYAHPADKYMPEKLSGWYRYDDVDVTDEDYDMLYGNQTSLGHGRDDYRR